MSNNRGRKPIFANQTAITEALIRIQAGTVDSKYLADKLVGMGLVVTSDVKGGGRGRPKKVYSLSESGQEMIRT